MNRFSPTVIVLLFFSSVVAPALAEDDGREKAKVAFQEGVVFFKAGNYEAATESFHQAYELHPTWKLYFNIAQCEAALKRYGLALMSFENYVIEGGDEVPHERQEEVRKEMARLRDLTGELEVIGPKDAVVEIDGMERGRLPLIGRIRVAAGNRELRIVREDVVLMERKMRVATQGLLNIEVEDAHPEATEATQEPDVASRNQNADEATLIDEEGESASSLATAGWITAGVGAAVLIGGTITGGIALSKEGQLVDACENEVCTGSGDKDVGDSAKSAALVTDILLPTGGVLLAAGVVMILVGLRDGEKGEETAKWRVTPIMGADTAGVMVRGRF